MIRNSKPKLNKEKAKHVILYFLNRLGLLTEEELSYLLYFCDMDYFEKWEEHFMGFTYIKNED